MKNEDRIIQMIDKNPGLTRSQLRYRLRIPLSTLNHHIEHLILEKKIIKNQSFKSRFFLSSVKEDNINHIIVKADKSLFLIYSHLQQAKNLEQLSELTNTDKSTISKRLQILQKMNLIEKKKVNKKIFFVKI
jgi:predicted transcriptional regulator